MVEGKTPMKYILGKVITIKHGNLKLFFYRIMRENIYFSKYKIIKLDYILI